MNPQGGTEFELAAIILGILNVIVMPIIVVVWRYTISTRKIIEEYKLHVAYKYMTKDDTNIRFDKIDKQLDRIWTKLGTIKEN